MTEVTASELEDMKQCLFAIETLAGLLKNANHADVEPVAFAIKHLTSECSYYLEDIEDELRKEGT